MTPTYKRDDMAVAYLSIKGHGSPSEAVWFGRDTSGPAQYGYPCKIEAVDGGNGSWRVTAHTGEHQIIGPRMRVWLAPKPEQVLNPSPVPIRLASLDLRAYGFLSKALRLGANAAADDVDQAEAAADRAALIAVRDALRAAAVEALVPRGGIGTPRCRRCSAACPHCLPPHLCRTCEQPIEEILPHGEHQYRHVGTQLVGCGPDGVDHEHGRTAVAEPGGPRR